jgi:hypothetical protein
VCSNTEHVIELLHTLQTIERGTDSFRRPPGQAKRDIPRTHV